MNRFKKAIDAYRAAGRGEEGEKSKQGGAPPDPAGAKDLRQEKRVQGLLKRSERDSGASRAARLLLLLEKDTAAGILGHLEKGEIERITREISRLDKIEGNEAQRILEDSGVWNQTGTSQNGGAGVARQMLQKAFGEKRGDEFFRKSVPLIADNPFDFLDDLDFSQILLLLKKEPARVIGIILPYLDAQKASMVLEALHPDLQMDVVKRISHMTKVSPEALLKVAEALRERIRQQGRVITEEIDGKSALAAILRHMSVQNEETILEKLEEYNPELSEEIRDMLITMEVLFQIDDQDLQALLRDFSDEEIAVILKGKKDDIRNRIFENLSERRGALVRAEMEHFGPMRRIDVDKSTREFLLYIRDLAEDGRLVFQRQDEYLQ